MKKTLVFYRGHAPRGEKASWVMHEFHLEGKLPHPLPRSAKDEWAICRVFNTDLAARNRPMAATDVGAQHVNSFGFISDFLDSVELPPLMDPSFSADVDEVIDFKGPASTSGHAAGGTGAHAASGMSYLLQVKMEEPVPLQYNHHQWMT